MKQTVFLCFAIVFVCCGCKSSIKRLELQAVKRGDGVFSAYYVPVDEPAIKSRGTDNANPAFQYAILSDEFQLFPVNTIERLKGEQAISAIRLISKDSLCSQQIVDVQGKTRLAESIYRISSVHESPAKKKIAFSCLQTPTSKWAVWVMNSDGSEPRLVAFGKDPVWKNETTLVFATKRSGSWTIVECAADGSRRRLLVKATVDCKQPRLSPDKKKIAFVRQAPQTSNSDIYVCNADGTAVSQVTNYPGRDDSPTWGTDGKSVYFRSTRDAEWGIWNVTVD